MFKCLEIDTGLLRTQAFWTFCLMKAPMSYLIWKILIQVLRMLRIFLHYGIHLIVPIFIAFYFFKGQSIKIAIILLLGILIDVDHLLANPIFDSNRCSINFHPLHSYWAIISYTLLLFFKQTRILGIALMIHILADTVDCLMLFLQAEWGHYRHMVRQSHIKVFMGYYLYLWIS